MLGSEVRRQAVRREAESRHHMSLYLIEEGVQRLMLRSGEVDQVPWGRNGNHLTKARGERCLQQRGMPVAKG